MRLKFLAILVLAAGCCLGQQKLPVKNPYARDAEAIKLGRPLAAHPKPDAFASLQGTEGVFKVPAATAIGELASMRRFRNRDVFVLSLC